MPFLPPSFMSRSTAMPTVIFIAFPCSELGNDRGSLAFAAQPVHNEK
jgi:hypothetical protein